MENLKKEIDGFCQRLIEQYGDNKEVGIVLVASLPEDDNNYNARICCVGSAAKQAEAIDTFIADSYNDKLIGAVLIKRGIAIAGRALEAEEAKENAEASEQAQESTKEAKA